MAKTREPFLENIKTLWIERMVGGDGDRLTQLKFLYFLRVFIS
jgi:hypothetical protein